VRANEPAPDQAPQPARALAPCQVLLAQLAELLACGDGAALDLLEQSGTSLKAALGEAGFREVAQAANDFDFEGALETLGRIVTAGRGTAGN
jgi:two-component system sensor histidine kinase/response regulator